MSPEELQYKMIDYPAGTTLVQERRSTEKYSSFSKENALFINMAWRSRLLIKGCLLW